MKGYGIGATGRVSVKGSRETGTRHGRGVILQAALRSQKKAARREKMKDINFWLEAMREEDEYQLRKKQKQQSFVDYWCNPVCDWEPT